MHRREFLKATSAAALSALATTPTFAEGPGPFAGVDTNAAKADAVILLFMAGGMSHVETFDPKRYRPFEKGMRTEDMLCTFPSIGTNVDGLKISAGLENIAQVMDQACLIRSHVLPDMGFILHTRHQYHWHTGYEPPQSVAAPHLGAWIAKARGPREAAMPPFIDIGQSFDHGEAEELKAFTTAGFLGAEFGPFRLPEPTQAAGAVRPPAGMSKKRFQERFAAYRKLLKAGPMADASDFQKQSILRSLDRAHLLMDSPAAKAFDLSQEPKESYDAYNTGKFGLGCLLARRCLEAGARFIEVSSEYIPFVHWDTHEQGHTRLVELKKSVDRPIAQLIRDLDQRGLLKRTAVVLATEFSRDALTEGKPEKVVKDQANQPDVISELKHYGMHRHFTAACSLVAWGGGFRPQVYGKTADERPCRVVEKPVSVTQFHATLYQALGIPPTYHGVIEKRPFYVTPDGKGKPVGELLG